MSEFYKRAGQPDLAFKKLEADARGQDLPLVVFLPGFRSDMEGTKAVFLEAQCALRGQACLRFDYSGHGLSGGAFTDGTISQWRDDALAIIESQGASSDLILVGSSMGGWIALLVALQLKGRVAGLVGIAAAPDFTIDIYENRMSQEQRDLLNAQGYVDTPNDYSDEPYRITKALMDDGMANCLLEKGIDLHCPVHLIQGKKDTDVDWRHAQSIKDAIAHDDVHVHLVEEGDHRLSRPQDLALIDDCIKKIAGVGA